MNPVYTLRYIGYNTAMGIWNSNKWSRHKPPVPTFSCAFVWIPYGLWWVPGGLGRTDSVNRTHGLTDILRQCAEVKWLVKFLITLNTIPDSKVHGANMGPIWGRQDPGGPHVGPMNFTIWDGEWRCRSVLVSQIAGSATVCSVTYSANSKENNKAHHCWPFVGLHL